MNLDSKKIVTKIAQDARQASYELANYSTTEKNQVLAIASKLLLENQDNILQNNQIDLNKAKEKGRNQAFLDRLLLTKKRISAMSKSLLDIINLDNPVGKIIYDKQRDNGLRITRKTVPLGVIAMIYEARPNVTIDAFALCFKSGNSVILRPSSESYLSSKAIMKCCVQALNEVGLAKNSVQILPSPKRELVNEMLSLDKYIDVIIPRGGKNLIKGIMDKSKIPVLKHLDGNCHSYIHKSANLEKAINVLYNAKLRRTGICGATESVVIDREILAESIKLIEKVFINKCQIRADRESLNYFSKDNKNIIELCEEDFYTEYLENIFSIKTVANIDEAIKHINKYSSKHTEAIFAEEQKAAQDFLDKIDSSIVMHNSSTQFADGGEFGLGAEIGISTGKLHARGPVGLEQLVTYKYQIFSDYQIRR